MTDTINFPELAETIRKNMEPSQFTADRGTFEKAEYAVIPHGMKIESLKPVLDEYRTKPDRRTGTVTADTLPSFIALANRFKGEASAVFARAKVSDTAIDASLTTVFNYHPEGGDNTDAQFSDHRSTYHFPLSKDFRFWLSANGRKMGINIHEEPTGAWSSMGMVFSSPVTRSFKRIEHLAKALYMGRWREIHVAMFAAYFDASGAPDDSAVLAVAGLIASVDTWIAFNEEWDAYLQRYEVKELHMKLFAHSEGEFSGWRGNEEKRRAFLSDGMALIEKHHTRSFGSAVICKGYWDEANELIRHNLPIYAYMGCVCIRIAKQWAESIALPFSDIRFVFADGDKGKGKLRAAAELVFETTPLFEPKAGIHAFEAADLLAYEQHLAVRKAQSAGELRAPFRRMAYSLRGADQWAVFTDAEIRNNAGAATAEYFSNLEE